MASGTDWPSRLPMVITHSPCNCAKSFFAVFASSPRACEMTRAVRHINNVICTVFMLCLFCGDLLPSNDPSYLSHLVQRLESTPLRRVRCHDGLNVFPNTNSYSNEGIHSHTHHNFPDRNHLHQLWLVLERSVLLRQALSQALIDSVKPFLGLRRLRPISNGKRYLPASKRSHTFELRN